MPDMYKKKKEKWGKTRKLNGFFFLFLSLSLYLLGIYGWKREAYNK